MFSHKCHSIQSLYVCLVSTRTSIGDGFLDLVNSLPEVEKSKIVLIKSDVYQDNEFSSGFMGVVSVKSKKGGMSLTSLWYDWCNVRAVTTRHVAWRTLIYGVSPLNFLIGLARPCERLFVWVHDPKLHPAAKRSEIVSRAVLRSLIKIRSDTLTILVASASLIADIKRLAPDPVEIVAIPFPYLSSLVDANKATTNDTDWMASRFRILFFGRIESYKGLPRLQVAMERLEALGLDFRCRVIGLGKGDPIVAPNTVHINSYVPNEILHWYLKSGHVCIFPYISVTGTQAVQSALALGAICIVSDLPLFRSFAEDFPDRVSVFESDVHLENILSQLARSHLAGENPIDRLAGAQRAREIYAPAKFAAAVYTRIQGQSAA